jgi:hypothetical protein
MLMLVSANGRTRCGELIIEDAVQILLPANDADETANDSTASLYGVASKARMTMNE